MYGIAIFGCGYVDLTNVDFTKIHEFQHGTVLRFEPGLAEPIAEQTAVLKEKVVHGYHDGPN
jgi:hypothetical protein